MARQIPKKLLQHSVVHRSGPTTDEWQNPTFTDVKTVKNVRVDPSSAVKKTKDNQEKVLAALMFYDCRNSSPREVTFAEGDQIEFIGMKYTVVSVEKLYDEKRLHHLEVGLI